jgi:hypothetical protein
LGEPIHVVEPGSADHADDRAEQRVERHRRNPNQRPERLARESQRRLRRNELARFNHWKKRHNRLPPLRVNQRE